MKVQKSTAAAVILLMLTEFVLARYSIRSITAVSPSFEAFEAPPTIIIDAGHGGFDGGAVGVDGIVEKDINLSIALKLYDLFTINGYDAILTRDRDIALNDETATTTRQKKNSDIHNRFDLMKTYDNCIFISIHQNKFTQSKYFGAQVFYGPKNPESQLLGEIMQANLIEMLQPENTRKSKPCTDSVYLIYNAPVPALLVECGFLSNADDAYKLVNADYQKRIAFAVFTGVSEYLNYPGRTEQPEGTKQVVWEFDPRSAMA